MITKSPYFLNTVLIALLLAAILASGMFGHVALPPIEFIHALLGQGEEGYSLIVQELRLPRILLGALVGATLGLSGAALQGLLRNPLADPGVVGVTASASFGAVVAIYFGLAAVSSLAVPVFAMVGASFATLLLVSLAGRDSSMLTLILAGMGISALAAAGISLVMNFAPTPMSVQEMVLWLLGSLENRTYDDLMLAGPFILLGWFMMIGAGQGLNALSLGRDTALTLGVNLQWLQGRIIAATALSVGAAVAVTGTVGFVGLVVPHFARIFVGHEPGRLLIPSALLGAILMLVADILTRLPVGHGQLKLGVVTALIGAPMFIYIIFKTRERMR